MKIVRMLIGLFVMASAAPFLIQGGLSRYAKYGIPANSEWRYLVIGLLVLAIGAVIFRPLPWKSRRSGG
jgi:hypothetical protein